MEDTDNSNTNLTIANDEDCSKVSTSPVMEALFQHFRQFPFVRKVTTEEIEESKNENPLHYNPNAGLTNVGGMSGGVSE